MQIQIVTPAPKDSDRGNNVTAVSWLHVLEELGHVASISAEGELSRVHSDCLVALHARKSATAILQFKERFPQKPVVVCLTGTDIHGDLQRRSFDEGDDEDDVEENYSIAIRSLELADAVVLLEPHCLDRVPTAFRDKCHIIIQAATPLSPRPPKPNDGSLRISVVGHLRQVKDPFRTAIASRSLPNESKIKIIQVGEALTESMRITAESENAKNDRYTWIGVLSHNKARELLCTSHATVVSSHFEGGCNVISDAVVNEVPIFASRMDASVGLLGEDYGGLFKTGDTEQLLQLMLRGEREAGFLESLKDQLRVKQILFSPAREKTAWKNLLDEVV